ncbi:MAG TPA: class I SAM-dependent methyltransferase [Acholeplasmataceae bacterium]|jgi:16S rRNA (guanine1207-N2)-methyltransferase|nr:class I SAM-dependent methyltransferase [Acholeplasmataceae bacterium]
MSHYYLNDPNLKSDKRIITYEYYGKELKFYSDLGVFSKNKIDRGTDILLNTLELEGKRVLDLGSGIGVIGVALASRDKMLEVTSTDVNERALALAKENYELNGIKNYSVFKSDGYENIKDSFDLIVLNPPIRAGKQIVDKLVLGAINYLNPNSYIWIVIRKSQGAPSLVTRMEEVYQEVEIVKKKKDYWIIKAR